MTTTTFELIELSNVKDGDMIVIKSDDISERMLTTIKTALWNKTGKRLILIGLPLEASLELLSDDAAQKLKAHLSKIDLIAESCLP